MLEKIGQAGYETLSKADEVVLRYLDQLLSAKEDVIYYEVGIGVGATTLPVAQRMAGRGKILLFSRENDVRSLAQDMRDLGFTNIDSSWGSPSSTYSGYHFELARGFVDKRLPSFDLAYIDGGHVFHLDAPAACILKELCKVDGFMIFDDWNWSMAKSPTMNPNVRPKTLEEYDTVQIETSHVPLVCKVIMDTDHRYTLLNIESNSAVYRRLS